MSGRNGIRPSHWSEVDESSKRSLARTVGLNAGVTGLGFGGYSLGGFPTEATVGLNGSTFGGFFGISLRRSALVHGNGLIRLIPFQRGWSGSSSPSSASRNSRNVMVYLRSGLDK